jgi:hypothetical protein
MGHHEGYFSDVLFKFCNNLLIKTKTNAVQVPVYIIREESLYVVHNIKNILVIIGYFTLVVEKGVPYGHFSPLLLYLHQLQHRYYLSSIFM